MGLVQAHHLLAQEHVDETYGIAGWRVCFAVIDGINRGKHIVARQRLIEAQRSEIFPNVLQRIAERFSDATRGARRSQQFRTVGNRPESEERTDARGRIGARSTVGDQREIAQSQDLAEAFVVSEDKGPVFDQRPAAGSTKDVALEVRYVA